jgi:hypothetical protein
VQELPHTAGIEGSEVSTPIESVGDGVLTFNAYLKHFGSCLPDGSFSVLVDRQRRRVTITCEAFDSHLVGDLVTRMLFEDHGIRAFRDDGAGWIPPPAPYSLRVRIAGESGVEFEAEVVRLSSAIGGGVAVRLSKPQLSKFNAE